MKSNYLAVLYFIVGFITSFSMIFQGKEPYVILGGGTLLLYLLFTLLDAIEEL